MFRNKIFIFLVLTACMSAFFSYKIISNSSLEGYALPNMWGPGIAAILTNLLFQRNLRGMGWQAGKFRHWVSAYFLPLLYASIVYGVVWVSGLGILSLEAPSRIARDFVPLGEHSMVFYAGIYVLVTLVLGFIMSFVSALGEEIGWRGLLVPELAKKYSRTQTALISGIVWAVWHYPILIFAGYRNAETPVWFSLTCFTAMIIGISFICTWLRLDSGSLWVCAVLHATHNMFIQQVFNIMTVNKSIAPYLTDEFGIGLALLAVGMAVFLWRRDIALHGNQPGFPFHQQFAE